jgi:hypothetical protein
MAGARHGPDGTLRCSRCRAYLPPESFGPDARGYRRSHCYPCALAATRAWRAAHRDELLARRRREA